MAAVMGSEPELRTERDLEIEELRRKAALYDAGVAFLSSEHARFSEWGRPYIRETLSTARALQALGVEPNGEG